MRKKTSILPFFLQVEIIDAAAEGVAIARVDGKVLFVKNAVPGDIADVQITKKRNSFFEGYPTSFHHYSDKREKPFCDHFGICGGCKWQHMKYEHQLFYKQKQVKDNLERIGKIDTSHILSIIPSANTKHYRNKLEFTFSDKRWLTEDEIKNEQNDQGMNALGFHIPKAFDKILNIENCYLQKEPSNTIRIEVKKYCEENNLSFFNLKNHTGLLRNLIIRNTSINQWMLIFSFCENDKKINGLLNHINKKFPELTSIMYVINNKKNDTITDLEIKIYSGTPFIVEEIEGLQFNISPTSFFQTNTLQAYELYKIVRLYADLKGDEIVYDLYTGTGTIANFLARSAKKIIGIEYVEIAVNDAKENSKRNNIINTAFYAGDIVKVLQDNFIETHGTPDVIVTDPPRAGMHTDIVERLIKISAQRIVYVSCNAATQARDIALLNNYYDVTKIQPIDMFPHTHHVECVVQLKKK